MLCEHDVCVCLCSSLSQLSGCGRVVVNTPPPLPPPLVFHRGSTVRKSRGWCLLRRGSVLPWASLKLEMQRLCAGIRNGHPKVEGFAGWRGAARIIPHRFALAERLLPEAQKNREWGSAVVTQDQCRDPRQSLSHVSPGALSLGWNVDWGVPH